VLVTAAGGATQPPIELPSPATAAMQVADAAHPGMAAVGCARHLVVFANGAIAWTTPVPSSVVAVGFAGDVVLAALEDGSLLAYQL